MVSPCLQHWVIISAKQKGSRESQSFQVLARVSPEQFCSNLCHGWLFDVLHYRDFRSVLMISEMVLRQLGWQRISIFELIHRANRRLRSERASFWSLGSDVPTERSEELLEILAPTAYSLHVSTSLRASKHSRHAVVARRWQKFLDAEWLRRAFSLLKDLWFYHPSKQKRNSLMRRSRWKWM